jgi:hypothetical protein
MLVRIHSLGARAASVGTFDELTLHTVRVVHDFFCRGPRHDNVEGSYGDGASGGSTVRRAQLLALLKCDEDGSGALQQLAYLRWYQPVRAWRQARRRGRRRRPRSPSCRCASWRRRRPRGISARLAAAAGRAALRTPPTAADGSSGWLGRRGARGAASPLAPPVCWRSGGNAACVRGAARRRLRLPGIPAGARAVRKAPTWSI